MSLDGSPFIKYFNPCSKFVDAIDLSIRGELKEESTLHLMDHVEKCKRCRQYYVYMESLDKGFKDYKVIIHEISPFSTQGLPSSLQEEIAQSMKRNLSKWLLESVRHYIYQRNLLVKFFLDYYDIYPIDLSLNTSLQLIRSLKNLKPINKDDISLLNESYDLLSSLSHRYSSFNFKTACNILDISISLDNNHFLPFFFYDQILLNNNDFNSAMSINDFALNRKPSTIVKSYLLNNKGLIFQTIGQYDQAYNSFIDSIEIFDNPISYMNLGLTSIQRNNIDESLVYINKAHEIINKTFSNNSLIQIKKIFSLSLKQYYIKYSSTIGLNSHFREMLSSSYGF